MINNLINLLQMYYMVILCYSMTWQWLQILVLCNNGWNWTSCTLSCKPHTVTHIQTDEKGKKTITSCRVAAQIKFLEDPDIWLLILNLDTGNQILVGLWSCSKLDRLPINNAITLEANKFQTTSCCNTGPVSFNGQTSWRWVLQMIWRPEPAPPSVPINSLSFPNSSLGNCLQMAMKKWQKPTSRLLRRT